MYHAGHIRADHCDNARAAGRLRASWLYLRHFRRIVPAIRGYRRGGHAGKETGAIDEIIQRECRFWIVAFQELAHIIADSGKPFQSGFFVEKILYCCGGHD